MRVLRRATAVRRTSVRLGLECFTSYHWLPPVVAALSAEPTPIDLRIAAGPARDPLGALARGTLDIAIMTSPARDRAWLATPLLRDTWVVALPPRHPLAQKACVSAADLASVRIFAHEAPRADLERLHELAAAEQVTWPRPSIVPLTEALLDLVAAGLGVALLSRWLLAARVARGEVVARPFTRRGIAEQWSLVTRRERPPAVQRAVEVLQATVKAP
jgi:LysR family transcriptional regulator for metE and metH